jgi:phage shock protein PspC (stress-responsive transcriptional regulator)
MKKLYRLPDEGKIAGICSGIADAYDLDPTVVRLAAVFLTAITMFWPGILTYCVGWWLIPEGRKGQEKGEKTEEQG